MNGKQMISLVKSFIELNDLALQNAALLLGGSPALLRLQRLRRAIATADRISTRLRGELKWLNGLLGLEYVHDVDRDASGFFAAISPDDPVVTSICALTDQLNALTGQLEAEQSNSAVDAIDAAA